MFCESEAFKDLVVIHWRLQTSQVLGKGAGTVSGNIVSKQWQEWWGKPLSRCKM